MTRDSAKRNKRVEAANEKQKKRRELQIRAKALVDSGYSHTEIASVLGVSEGTVHNILKENADD